MMNKVESKNADYAKVLECIFDFVAEYSIKDKKFRGCFSKSDKEFENMLFNLDDFCKYMRFAEKDKLCESFIRGVYDKNANKTLCISLCNKERTVKKAVLTFCPKVSEQKVFIAVNISAFSNKNMTVTINKVERVIDLESIIYVGYGNHRVEFYTEKENIMVSSINFAQAAETLLRHSNFIRSYKNCIINMDKVKKIEDDAFLMKTNDILSIPKRRLREIKAAYSDYKCFSNI